MSNFDQAPLTVAELPDFSASAERLWLEAEREEFVDFIARNPEAVRLCRQPVASEKFGGAGKDRASAEAFA